MFEQIDNSFIMNPLFLSKKFGIYNNNLRDQHSNKLIKLRLNIFLNTQKIKSVSWLS